MAQLSSRTFLLVLFVGGSLVLQSRRLSRIVEHRQEGTTTTIVTARTITDVDNTAFTLQTTKRTETTVGVKGLDTEFCPITVDSCIEHLAASIGRVWPHKSIDAWCFPSSSSSSETSKSKTATAKSSSPTTTMAKQRSTGGGLILIKVPKSASSTAAAVVLRIHDLHQCHPVSWEHGRAADKMMTMNATTTEAVAAGVFSTTNNALQRHYTNNRFLLAPVRTPESRALSSVYFFQVSFHRFKNNNKRSPADNFILKHVAQTKPNFITDYMRLGDVDNNNNANTTLGLQQYVREIMDAYDFMMVADRMDESLVVLSLLTDLPVTTVLTMSSKQAAGKNNSWYYTGKRCVSLSPPMPTAAVVTYFSSDEWKWTHAADRLLYAAANRSLDQTIAALGGSGGGGGGDSSSSAFQSALTEYRRLQMLVHDACQNETYFPCSSDSSGETGGGTPQLELAAQSCYVRDFGCGYPCIDRVLGVVGETAAAAAG